MSSRRILPRPRCCCGRSAARACDSGPERPPIAESVAAIAELENAVAAAKIEVQRLRDVDELENLASIYGHYVDKSRHDDVADLFAPDGVVEILGRGVFIGQDRVREYMRNLTPGNVGPRDGSLFNHMHLQPVIDVSPDGETAHVRSRLFVMFGIHERERAVGRRHLRERVRQAGRRLEARLSARLSNVLHELRGRLGEDARRRSSRRTSACRRIGRNPCRTRRIRPRSCRRSTTATRSRAAPITTRIRRGTTSQPAGAQ